MLCFQHGVRLQAHEGARTHVREGGGGGANLYTAACEGRGKRKAAVTSWSDKYVSSSVTSANPRSHISVASTCLQVPARELTVIPAKSRLPGPRVGLSEFFQHICKSLLGLHCIAGTSGRDDPETFLTPQLPIDADCFALD